MRTILLADDDHIVHVMIRRLLGAEFHVESVFTGEEALEYLLRIREKDKLPDLILMDIRMEGIQGIETCRQIREDERLKTIPVIFITAETDPATKERCLSEGAVDYIVKPFVPRALLNSVHNAIR